MNPIRKRVANLKRSFYQDSLFKNASFLMASTAIMSVLGFGFWLFVAHLYSPPQIGEASALIAVTLLISNLSMLGLNSGLVRFLPESPNQSRDINAAMATVGLIAMAAAGVYLGVARYFGASAGFFAGHSWSWVVFPVLMAAVALNTLTDSIFIANRRAEFHTFVYGVFGVVKLILPLFLVPFGSIGVFTAYIIAVIVSLLLSLYFMKHFFSYKMRSKPNWNLLPLTRIYATSNYLGVILSGLPAQVMPLIIINRLGAAEAAYFSMAWAMANLLYVIPSSLTQSLLAESSHRPALQRRNMVHAAKILAAILVPVVLAATLVAPHLLRIFGRQYAVGGTVIFQIMALSTFFVAVNNFGNTILNIEKRSAGIIAIQLSGVIATLGATEYLIRFGLTGVGVAMLLGYFTTNIVYGLMHLNNRRRIRKTLHGRVLSSRSNFTPTRHSLESMLCGYGLKTFEFSLISQGAPNATILVASGGNKYVLRVYQQLAKTTAEIQEEISFINFLADKSLPVPRILPSKQGQYIEETVIGGASWRHILMEFEPGSHPRKYSHALLSNMAETQARIHRDGIAFADANPAARKRVPSGILRKMLPLKHTPNGFSHFDYDGTNILVDRDSIACVLDFEGARFDSLVICTYFTLSQLYIALGDPRQLEHYLESYQKVRKLQRVEKWILRAALALRFKTPKMLRLLSA